MDPLFLAAVLFVILMLVVNIKSYHRFNRDKSGFLLANREVTVGDTAMSIAASWTYAFGLIMVASFTFAKGLAGWVWFVIPQLLVLAMMAVLATWLVRRFPNGFTITEFIQHRYGDTVTTRVFHLVLLFAIFNALIGNLTGFGIIAEYVAGGSITYNAIVMVLGGVVVAYSLLGGLRASVRTDVLQMLILLALAMVGLVLGIMNWQQIVPNLSEHPVQILDTGVILAPGLLLLILLSGAAINDNGFYQRIFACQDKHQVHRAFLYAAALFVLVMLGTGVLAALALSQGLTVPDAKLSATVAIESFLGTAGLVLICLAVLAAAASTMDTALNSFGSIVANDFLPGRDAVVVSRWSILAVGTVSILIALLKIDIWLIFVIFGLLRLITVFPMIAAITTDWRLHMPTVLISMLVALFWALLVHLKIIAVHPVLASLITVCVPLLGVVIARRPNSTSDTVAT